MKQMLYIIYEYYMSEKQNSCASIKDVEMHVWHTRMPLQYQRNGTEEILKKQYRWSWIPWNSWVSFFSLFSLQQMIIM